MSAHTTGTRFLGFKGATASGTNTAVTVTLAAVTGNRHYIGGLVASYSADPTSGRLTSTGLEGDEVDTDITAAGTIPFGFPPLVGDSDGAVTFTLAAGGAGITGKLSVFYLTFA